VNTVCRYSLEGLGNAALVEVEMPQGSRILGVQVQKKLIAETPYLWALVNTEEGRTVRRLFRIYGTGREVEERPEALNYIGTVQTGPFVWHVFERNVGKLHIRKVPE